MFVFIIIIILYVILGMISIFLGSRFLCDVRGVNGFFVRVLCWWRLVVVLGFCLIVCISLGFGTVSHRRGNGMICYCGAWILISFSSYIINQPIITQT